MIEEILWLLRGKVPYLLLDYIKYDGAPEPLRFVNKDKTYIRKQSSKWYIYRVYRKSIATKCYTFSINKIPFNYLICIIVPVREIFY